MIHKTGYHHYITTPKSTFVRGRIFNTELEKLVSILSKEHNYTMTLTVYHDEERMVLLEEVGV